MSVQEPFLLKLLNSAIAAARKAEDGTDAAEEARATDALRVLGQQQVTAELLAKTSAGKSVKKLEKHSIASIAAAAAATVAAWKECVRKEKGPGGPGAPSPAAAECPEPKQSQPQPSVAAAVDAGAAGLSSQGSLQRAASDKLVLEPEKTGDETRDKIRKLLAEALALALAQDACGDPCAAAVSIEKAMFAQARGVNAQYKAKFRTLSFNLKDPKNPDLRAKVLEGDIPAHELVELSAESLASSELRAQNDQRREHILAESIRGIKSVASTDQFQCGRCKQRKCTYYQMQTRSADEPMTTFVTCTVCEKRWKFC